ncbi:DUF1566 domain-containing protein [Sorangium sp. So ce295]|uniref:Lcl C-terminal domain-containing protein n=1 Tax=Sorangium sp. So ce295 TaxID=3133295 RepID=UPI003F605DBD
MLLAMVQSASMPSVDEKKRRRGQGRLIFAPFLFLGFTLLGCDNSLEASSPKTCGENCSTDQDPTSPESPDGTESDGTENDGTENDGTENCSPSDPALFQMARWPMPGSTGEDHSVQYRVDEEVTHDEITGLDWQRQLAPVSLTDEHAAEYCAELILGGHCDWRLPTRVEGVSLLDLQRKPPSFDPGAFPDIDGELVLWSGNPERLFRLGSDGSLRVRSPTIAGPDRVRCVRGGGVPDSDGSRYELTPDLARDLGTGLTWTRATSKQTYADAASMCAGLQLDEGGFRVPSLKELHTLIFDSKPNGPWIDQSAFPSFPAAVSGHILFWTSSLEATDPNSAWMLDFATGTAEATAATANFTLESTLHVLCVRSRP